MAIYGASTFDVYIKPMLNGSNVSFQGKATFEQDGVVHSFYLIDDSAYHQVVDGSIDTTTCLPADSIPSVSDIVEAIASATAISSVNTDQDISCTNGTWLSTTFSGESYVLCTGSDINENNFTVYGEDLSVTFEYLSEDVTITKPKSAPIDCEGAQDNSVELSSLGQVYGISLSGSHRALKEEAGAVHLASSTCACQGTPRPCLFFHGMDVAADGGIVNDYSFFGDIKEHAPCCSSFNFAVLNTEDYEWYNDTLQQKACDAAMNVSTGNPHSGSTEINELIVVAHSMGNSMFAGALATGKCSIGKNVDWVALSGPMKGSMGSDFIHEICGSSSGSNTLLSKLGSLIAARAIHAKYVTAGICGTTYNGLLSKEYAGLLAGGLVIPHHSSKNDGIVEFQSCVGDLDASKFDTTYASTWYAAKLNHADTTFHDGDGLFSSAQKPLKWFECLL
uniref:Uncharacterized protein n=1 Tax=Phytophthora ramorum TaxID=164328 RepID=H3GKL3_PHYRM